MPIYIAQLTDDKAYFPDLNCALKVPDGLLAMGGDLTSQRIMHAYNNGIFPWFSDTDPILWWSPSKRATIEPSRCHISKSMKKFMTKSALQITINCAFAQVIKACAQPREYQAETWITDTMISAYLNLHRQGFAHSVEIWQGEKLVAGLYGVCIGTLFCGESMFSSINNGSKLAFIALNQHLKRHQGSLIDCQMQTPHLRSLGAEEVSREQFISALKRFRDQKLKKGCWERQEIVVSR